MVSFLDFEISASFPDDETIAKSTVISFWQLCGRASSRTRIVRVSWLRAGRSGGGQLLGMQLLHQHFWTSWPWEPLPTSP